MNLIDFTHAERRKKAYSGANGNKFSIIYDNELYMLKFPALATKNDNMSYSNGCFSEYLGCHIYDSIGIPVQKTLLGTYMLDKKQKIVVACKDFTEPGITLQDFASLKNQVIESSRSGYGTDLYDIINTMQSQTSVDPSVLSGRFWDMFVIDALIGNWDRHNGNWGFLYDARNDSISLAPVYDCGSCLFPQADEEKMKSVISNAADRNHRVYNIPTSALTINNRRINIYSFVSSLQDKDCNMALKRIVPRIDLESINSIIEEMPFATDLQKDFYRTILKERKERILDHSLKKLEKKHLIQPADSISQNKRNNIDY